MVDHGRPECSALLTHADPRFGVDERNRNAPESEIVLAKTRIPGSLERRHLIEKELPVERSLGIAEAYLAEDRVEEAIVFLGKADAQDRLDEVLEQSIESGNVFALQAITRVRRTELPPSVWQRVAERARAAGKDLYAEAAERQANRSDD